ncbi:DDE_Tnp_IS1595 domain-containing protein, partial [Meloidogyne graminicola]
MQALKGKRYGNWRCTSKNCRKTQGYLCGTFFQETHLELKKIFELSYFWARRYGKYEELEFETGISRPAICDWLNFFRDICAEYFIRNPIQIGGEGIVCELDETIVVRRKYERGRIPVKNSVWLLGGVERGISHEKCFLAVIEGKRSAENMIPMIQQYINPGSVIHTDLWKSYNSIPSLPQNYTHFSVNHSTHFLNPSDPNIHTQNIESLWSSYKRKFRHQAGNNSNTYETYFPEFLWRKRFGDISNVFYNFWLH